MAEPDDLALVEHVRRICLDLPDVLEKSSHGSPSFFLALTPTRTKQFLTMDVHHHGADRVAFWCAAEPGVQEELLAENPQQFFRPPYVGHRGWIGVRIDCDPDWEEIAEIISDARRVVGGVDGPARAR
jgi:hypothetical protein